ncbi:MAG: ATP-dependent DNA helicase [Lautropia sp.]
MNLQAVAEARESDALEASVAGIFGETGALAANRPGFSQRESQRELAIAVARAIQTDGCLIAEAGTGTGKTFSYLVPVLLSGRKVIVSTGTRQLQDQLFQRDLVELRGWLGVGIEIAILKGRANYVCPFHLQRNRADGRFADRSIPAKLRQIEQFARTDPVGDKAACGHLAEDDPAWQLATSTRDNCLGQDCPELRQCPLMRARQRAQKADLLVINHHLFCADMALKDESIGDFLPEAQVFVFDEAHQLPDTATDFFGESLSTRQLVELARDTLKAGLLDAADGADWRALSGSIEQEARALRLVFGRDATRHGHEQLRELRAEDGSDLAGVVARIAARMDVAAQTLAAQQERSAEIERCAVRAGEMAARARRWITQFEAIGSAPASTPPDSPAVVWAQVSAHHAALRLTPLSVARYFAQQRTRLGGAWIFVSATLAVDGALGHFAASVGLPQATQLVLPSPFDYQRQSALWLADAVGPPSAPDFPERIARRVWPLIRSNRGRAFVLCTTLRAVRMIGQTLRECAGAAPDPIEVLVQTEASRTELLERFRRAQHDGAGAVLVGAASFWEGVDVAGDGLSLVVIDKLPFAPPDDPVVAARSKAIEAGGGNAFADLSLPTAALALKQGAGRLIRSERDRGLLVIGDERMRTKGYGRRLLASLPPYRRVASLEDATAFLPAPSPRVPT